MPTLREHHFHEPLQQRVRLGCFAAHVGELFVRDADDTLDVFWIRAGPLTDRRPAAMAT
jgi:hypothetical protein